PAFMEEHGIVGFPADHWAAEAITSLVAHGYFRIAETPFRIDPEEPITYRVMATHLLALAGVEVAAEADPASSPWNSASYPVRPPRRIAPAHAPRRLTLHASSLVVRAPQVTRSPWTAAAYPVRPPRRIAP